MVRPVARRRGDELPAAHDTERGMTLIELMVAMSIFLIFMAMILGTTVTLAQNASRSQATSEASNFTLTVFGAFDRQVRYADAVNFPGTGAGGSRYVEFRTPGASSVSGVTTCTQWRYSPSLGRLDSRTWSDLPSATVGAWSTKQNHVIDDGGAGYPFELKPASVSGSTMQQLVVTIHAGSASLDAGAAMSTSFVARNSSISSPSNLDLDNNKESDTPVCPAGNRP